MARPKTMKAATVVAAGCAILGLVGCGTAAATPAAPASSPTPTTVPAAAAPLTLASYAKVQNGMTLVQVQAILGGPGIATTTLPDSTAGNEDAVYMWGSPAQTATGGGMVLVTLQGGAVIARSEIGLG